MSDRRGAVSQQDSYDVYVRVGVDRLGADDFGTAVAHFVERTNAVELKRELEARGATVRVEKSIVRLPKAALPAWFSDYEPPPQGHEYVGEDAARASESGRKPVDIEKAPPSWWRRAFGG